MLLGDEPMFAAGVGAGLPVGGEAVCASCVGGSDPVPPVDRATEVASNISATGPEAIGAADAAGKLALSAADLPCAITGPAAFSAANAARANVSNAAIIMAAKRIITSVNLPIELCALLA